MGCGSSTAHKPQAGEPASPPPKVEPAGSPNAKRLDVAAVNNTPPVTAPTVVSPDKASTAASMDGSGAEPIHEVNTGREKHFNVPHYREVQGSDKKRYLLVCHGDLEAPLRGLTVSVRSETGDVCQKVWTDAELFADKSTKGKPLEKFPASAFWRGLGLSVTKGDFKVSEDGQKVDFALRQSKEPKNANFVVELAPLSGEWSDTYESLLAPFIYFYSDKLKKDLSDEEKARREREVTINHLESSILFLEHESFDMAAATKTLKQEAQSHRETLDDLENKISQMNRQLKVYQNNGVTELDELYAANTPTDTVEPQELPMDGWGHWNFDAAALKDTAVVHVAWTLCLHYNLVSALEIDKTKFANFWAVMQSHYADNPYHNAARAVEVLLSTHCIISALGLGQYEGKMDGVVLLSNEDILAMVLAAGIIDLGHEGLDNDCLKESKQFIANFYNGHFILEQNRLAIPFETLENQSCNFFVDIDQEREIRETVVEVLFMKANAEMLTISEKMVSFTERLAMFDWTQKEHVRIVLTMAMRCADIASWAREQSIHTARLEKLVEEFYLQGDVQIAHGLVPTPFIPESPWTADRTRHRQNFPRGQVHFIDTMVVPLLESMQALFPGFSPLLSMAEENKKYWQSQIEAVEAEEPIKTPYQVNLSEQMKCFGMTKDRKALLATMAVETDGFLVVTAATKTGVFSARASEDDLKALGGDAVTMVGYINDQLTASLPLCDVQLKSHDSNLSYLDFAGKQLALRRATPFSNAYIMKLCQNFVRLRSLVRDKDLTQEVEDLTNRLASAKEEERRRVDQHRIFSCCLESCTKALEVKNAEAARLTKELCDIGAPGVDDGLVVCVRNPLASPMPVGVTKIPDCRDIDTELFKIVKSQWDPHVEEDGEADGNFCNVIRPYTKSEFASVTESLSDEKRNTIWKLVSAVDDWDFDVFTLQREMSGGYTHEGLANQPHGGSLFITQYALFYKYGFMRKFNIDERKMINWLSMIEAGYHPNPYHNSMHAADVLQVSHYILLKGGMISKYKVSDEDVFCTLFASSVHDYNHPGINNSFHVKTQNYLAVLWNDRSVNENVHASSVFEIMRLEQFDILESFSPEKRKEIRETIVELVLGTDMGLHAQILGKFKKKLETNLRLSRRADMTLALIMVVKMADISNCGRPKNLYHAWCNQIVDEFYMQGDRERLLGLAVSPFMDRYTTVISRGQTAFMTYIVVPLFECMAEFLPDMSHATELTELNKYFWLENTFW